METQTEKTKKFSDVMTAFFRAPLYLLVFATGASGLIFQVTWQKYLSRILGSDSMATAIILGTFLGGLSVGYLVCGKLTMRVKNHFKAYALLEAVIGIWCIFFPMIFELVEGATRSWSLAPGLIIFQGMILSILLLGIPTIAMGGTVPFLTRGVSRNFSETTSIHAKVYAINTAGAFIGTLLAGFLLIPALGLPATMMTAAFLNILTAAFFFILSRAFPNVESVEMKKLEQEPAATSKTQAMEKVETRYPAFILYAVAFLSGFYVMTLENVFIRMTNLSLGSSSYSFSIIVAVFILAIAIGSYVLGERRKISKRLLYFNQMGITLLLLVIYFTLDLWPYAAHVIRIAFQNNIVGFWAYYAAVFVIMLLLLGLPVSFMGATVPITFHELRQSLVTSGKHSGTIFSWNTLGNLIGSLFGGIVFYYFMNIPNVFLMAVLMAGLTTCLIGWFISKRLFATGLVLSALILILNFVNPSYDFSRFKIGTFRMQNPVEFSLSGADKFYDGLAGFLDQPYYNDGIVSSVSVLRTQILGKDGLKHLSIVVNGKSDSSTSGDAVTLKLSAHIPALLAKQRRNAFVVGLGSGVTAGELTLYPEIEEIDVAEISPGVVEALPLFGEHTNNLHNEPRAKMYYGDAFRIMGRSDKKWDIIISEPSNPWVTGVELLFTQEFYKLAREHLTEDGLLLQWFYFYASSKDMIGMVQNTIAQEFPYVRTFVSNRADILILASLKPIEKTDLERAENYIANNEGVRKSLGKLGIQSLDSILVREIWSPELAKRTFGDYELQTMDNPKLHYEAGKNFFIKPVFEETFLLGSRSALFKKDYLMIKKYPGWADIRLTPERYEEFKQSVMYTHTVVYRIVDVLALKANMNDPETFHLTRAQAEKFDPALIEFISGKEGAVVPPKLANMGFRQKTEKMLEHIHNTRSWVVPYSLSGLERFLGEGMEQAANDAEKNFCGLQLITIMLQEGKSLEEVKSVFARLKRDGSGRLILHPNDRGLYMRLEGFLK